MQTPFETSLQRVQFFQLEQEIANIYRVHEELVQSCERRERLEKAARSRLQQDCRRLQELNRAFRDQVEVLQNQLLTSSDHQLGRTQQDVLISQLVTQSKLEELRGKWVGSVIEPCSCRQITSGR